MRRHLWAVVGLVLLAAGVWLVLPLRGGDDDGWTADTPTFECPSDTGCIGFSVISDAIVLPQRQTLGCLIGILGLLVIAGGVGFRLGQRRRR